MRNYQRSNKISLLAKHIFLLCLLSFFLFPFYWMIITSFRAPQEIFTASFHWLPQKWIGFKNYIDALNTAPILRYMLNGVIISSGILLVQLITAIPCAWALAKFRFNGKKLLYFLIILGLCIPIQVPAIPIFLVLAQTNQLDSYFALMLPFFLSVFAIFLFYQSFKSFPNEVIQAARIDGFSEFSILWRIAVPAVKPAIAAFSIFSVTAHWNDLYWPLIAVSSNPELSPPSLGAAVFSDTDIGTDFGPMMAAATILTLPLMAVFLMMRRAFIQGITLTGIK